MLCYFIFPFFFPFLLIDKPILVPLTSSMYVPGKLSNIKSVLLDVGTGYFVDKSIEDSKTFLDGKLEMLAKNVEKVKLYNNTKKTTDDNNIK